MLFFFAIRALNDCALKCPPDTDSRTRQCEITLSGRNGEARAVVNLVFICMKRDRLSRGDLQLGLSQYLNVLYYDIYARVTSLGRSCYYFHVCRGRAFHLHQEDANPPHVVSPSHKRAVQHGRLVCGRLFKIFNCRYSYNITVKWPTYYQTRKNINSCVR